jgi:hypothetical protein
MRSELVHTASKSVANRFMLCRMVCLTTRSLHVPNATVQHTINDVLKKMTSSTLESGFVMAPAAPKELVPPDATALLAAIDAPSA